MFSCSGMFRDVPECSGMFRDVPCSGFYRRPLKFGHVETQTKQTADCRRQTADCADRADCAD